MRLPRNPTGWIVFLAIAACVALPAAAQQGEDDPKSRRETRATDRLFLSFAEEATLVERQWWEGQIEYRDNPGFEITSLRGVAAFQPWDDVEFGGTVGFGDSSGTGSGGSGATDLDLWAKFHFGEGGKTEYAAGALLTVPTGDDAAGLGMDAFSLGAFGSLRHRAERATYTGNLAIRANGDGRFFTSDIDGEASVVVGAGVIVPANERLSFVGEARFETERFSGAEADMRVLGGINLAAGKQGALRAALALGLTDGAPDAQLIVGYASSF